MSTIHPVSENNSHYAPVRLLHYLIDKIKRVFETILTSCIFTFNAAVRGNWFIRKLVGVCRGCSNRREKTFSCMPRPISIPRLKESLKYFELLGGKFHYITGKDGERIQYFHVTADKFGKKIKEQGGEWKEITLDGQQCLAIIPTGNKSEEWKSFSKDCLSKFGWETTYYEGKLVFVTARGYSLADKRCCFVYSHTFGKVVAMDRKRLGMLLGSGADVCMSDLRGGLNCSGEPSLEGYYGDSEAVLEEMLLKYKDNELWVGGTCLGGFIAAHQKGHRPGVNFWGENMAFCLHEDICNFGLLRRVIRWSLSKFASLHFRVDWKGLKDKQLSRGKVVIMRTDTDTVLSYKGVKRIEAAARVNGFPFKEIINHGPRGKQGHCLEPMFDWASRRKFMRYVRTCA